MTSPRHQKYELRCKARGPTKSGLVDRANNNELTQMIVKIFVYV